MSVTVVVPTYNERDNLETLCTRVLEVLPQARILIVDDNSPDGTGQLADTLVERDPDHLAVLHRKGKEGLGAAYVAGYAHALEQWPDAEFFIQMDADLSHDPSYLLPMLDAAQDADVVVGSRYTHGVSIVNWPMHRLIVSRLGTLYARMLTGLPITDCTSGFKCYRAEVLRAIELSRIRSNGYVFQVETSFRAWRLGYRIVDLPIIFYERARGESKLHLGIAFEALRVVAGLGLQRLFKSRPVRP
jgi:dolichol-phosphate mannosyltransferase